MKKTNFCALFGIALCLLLACNKTEPTVNKSSTQPTELEAPKMQTMTSTTAWVDVPTANAAIRSYLASIDSFSTQQINAFFVDADVLRTYLADNSIKEVALLLGHRSAVIQSPLDSVYHYMNPNAMTVFIAGIDINDDYVLYDDTYIINHIGGCPMNCKGAGTAASPIISP